jgi:hypothetical protein
MLLGFGYAEMNCSIWLFLSASGAFCLPSAGWTGVFLILRNGASLVFSYFLRSGW